MKRFYSLFVFLLFACTTIKYSDDSGFLVSAQADSPEFPVYLNGKICKDTDGIPGLCTKRLRSNEPLVIRMDARPYSYKLQLACSKDIGVSQSFAVEKDQPFEFTIKPEQFAVMMSFICVGEVMPDDRELPVSAKWKLFASIVDQAYVQRETAYITKKGGRNFLIMGQHARSVNVFDEGKWKTYKEKPVIEISGDPAKVIAYSESFNMRFNALGF